jgi:hypothetical protein
MRILDVRSFGLVAPVVLVGCGAEEGYDPRVITIQVDHDFAYPPEAAHCTVE